MSLIERRLIARLKEHLPDAAPSLRLQVHQNGEKICDIVEGETYPYYDLASLTKIIFTVPALMLAYEQGRWNLASRVSEFWPSFPMPGVKITEFLRHSAGALWWHPFYREVDLDSPEAARRAWLKSKIEGLEWKPPGECVYSDIGILVLGFCLETMFQKPLIEIWQEFKKEFYPKLDTLDFHPGNHPLHPRLHYAPTEQCSWRGRRMQGEVHDENAWAFGGISSHAGLFSGIDDLSGYGLFLRDCMGGTPAAAIAKETMTRFAERCDGPVAGDFALGFMVPSRSNSSCGRYFSPASIGHTGFTGTSLWYDPKADLLVAILSNRVFFGRERENFKRLRPMIHDWVVEELSRN